MEKKIVCHSTDFNVQQELVNLKKQTKLIRNRHNRYKKNKPKKSVLDQFRTKLLLLKKGGATNAELRRFLQRKRVNVVHSTVARWIKKNG